MKRILSLTLALTFLVGTSLTIACPVKEVNKGLKTILTSPSELTDNIKSEVNSTDFIPIGLVGGALKGTFYMGKQMVDGVWRILVVPYHIIRKL